VNQVFYVKDMSRRPKIGKHDEKKTNEPKHHIVLIGKRNIMGIEDKSDMSQDYEKDEQSHPYVWPKTQASCSLLRTLHGYGMIITKGITSRRS